MFDVDGAELVSVVEAHAHTVSLATFDRVGSPPVASAIAFTAFAAYPSGPQNFSIARSYARL